ncbi:hypothetical protein AGMMS49938_10970 [Fibrobacterales bacterium]|nr:hypothetical protein AGMMS49938_10970 [Fibrobacterales bacterium]
MPTSNIRNFCIIALSLFNFAFADSRTENADKLFAQGNFEAAAAAYNSVCTSLNPKDKKLCLFSEVKSLMETKKIENAQKAEIKLVSLLSQTEPSDSLFSPLFAADTRLQIMLSQPERAVRSWNTTVQSANSDFFPTIYLTCLDLIENFPSNGLTNENCQKVRPADTTLISLPRTKTAPLVKVTAVPAAKPPTSPSPVQDTRTANGTTTPPQNQGCLIQLGAFGNRANAEKLVSDFAKKSVPLNIAETPGSALFIVRSDKFATQVEAAAFAEQKIAPFHHDYKILPCK